MLKAKQVLAMLLSLMLLLAALGGCAKKDVPAEPAGSAEAAVTAEPTEAAQSAEPAEETEKPERADGEEFEATILVEGMEETVNYRHIRNETAGFAMDYEFENFERRSAADRECIIWGYDDPEHPENYLEVAYSSEDAETVAEKVSAALSADYEPHRDTVTLDGAGDCIRIDASEVKGGGFTADILQEVYLIPAADGCRVATIRYIPEGGDGFGKRLSAMVNTITVTEAHPTGDPLQPNWWNG